MTVTVRVLPRLATHVSHVLRNQGRQHVQVQLPPRARLAAVIYAKMPSGSALHWPVLAHRITLRCSGCCVQQIQRVNTQPFKLAEERWFLEEQRVQDAAPGSLSDESVIELVGILPPLEGERGF